MRERILGAFAFIIACVSISAGSQTLEARFQKITKNCIRKSQRQTQCVRVVDGNPLDFDGKFMNTMFSGTYNSGYAIVGFTIQGVSAAGVLADPEGASHWSRVEAKNNFEILKKFAKIRAEKDDLSSCQRACLATCISSSIIDYDDRNIPTHWTESVGREQGLCREFSGLAVNVARSLGVKASVITGAVYEILNGQKPEKIGGHAMMQVTLPSGQYIMEPQSSDCEFFDKSFSKEVRHIKEVSLN